LADVPKVVIIAALRQEIDELLTGEARQVQYLQEGKSPTYIRDDFSITCAGIGPLAASDAADALIQQLHPELVISVGFAGAADPSLSAGAVITPKTVIDTKSGLAFSTIRGEGVLVSSPKIVNAQEKAQLRQRYGALAVDMEAAAVAERAHHYGIPFLGVKSISDTSETTLPDLGRFVREDGAFSTTSFLTYLMFHPTWWPAVRRLAINSTIAARTLASSLREILSDRSLMPAANSGQVLNSR
jgi:adenosylhomocysteine nucleosidase